MPKVVLHQLHDPLYGAELVTDLLQQLDRVSGTIYRPDQELSCTAENIQETTEDTRVLIGLRCIVTSDYLRL